MRLFVYIFAILLFFEKRINGNGNNSSSVRSLIERIHHVASPYQQATSNSVARNDIEDSDLLFTLPLRSAVEKVLTSKERAEEEFPLRQAVEKIPPLNNFIDNVKSQSLYKQSGNKEKEYKVVCYVASWSWYRKHDVKFTPDYIDADLCTHLVYAFASLNPENFTIMAADPVTDFDREFYKKITSPEVKKKAKVLISVGGWTDSSGDKYSLLVSSGNNRRKFVNSVIAFLRRYNFHGLHLDWNYPVCWQARCSEEHISDRANFAKLIQELRKEFDKQHSNYELAVAISGYKEIIDVGYDVLTISENADFLSVMTYDYHGGWENYTGHVSPLYGKPNDMFPDYNSDSALSSLVLLGAEPRKLVMGVPFFGQSFTLADTNHHRIGDKAIEPGLPGYITQQPGILSYYEICTRVMKEGWQTERDPVTDTEPYAYKGNQWVGFDDKRSLRKKVEYVKKSGYGGIMTWTIDMDDFNNDCCTGIYPLLTEINIVLERKTSTSSNYAQFDCKKPTTTSTTPTTPLITTETDYSGDYTTDSLSSTTTTGNPWNITSLSMVSSSITHSTKPWWPPTLTMRPDTSRYPRPTVSINSTTQIASTTAKWTTKKRKTTRITPALTSSTTNERPYSNWTEISTEGGVRETTPLTVDHCSTGKYFPDPTDCTSYYRCIHGKKKKETCAPGLHWNIKSENCDWPVRADCKKYTVSTGASFSSTESIMSTLTSSSSSLPSTTDMSTQTVSKHLMPARLGYKGKKKEKINKLL